MPTSSRPAPARGASSASLDALETTVQTRRVQTRAQVCIHKPWEAAREKIAQALIESTDASLSKRGDRIDDCCAYPQVAVTSKGKPALVLQCCKDQLCPRCQQHRGNEAARKIAGYVRQMNAPRLITLTLKHRKQPLKAELDRLHAAFRELRKQPIWHHKVKKGVYAIETTKNLQTARWHVHVHIICDGEYFDQKQLSNVWKKITGDSHVVHIEAVHDRDKAARYVATYVAKPANVEAWSHDAIREYAVALHGRRLLHTFGGLHGVAIDEREKDGGGDITEHLCSVQRVADAAMKGFEMASHALDIMQRMGPTWARACGLRPLPMNSPAVPIAEWESDLIVQVCRQLAAGDPWTVTPAASKAAAAPVLPSLFKQ